VRTLLARAAATAEEDPFGESDSLDRLKGIEVAGPLGLAGAELAFPAPLDCRVEPGTARAVRLEPRERAGGCDLPHPTLLPIANPLESESPPPGLWPASLMARWLSEAVDAIGAVVPLPQPEERVHVAIRPEFGTADEGRLFMTQGLAFPELTSARAPALSMAVRYDAADAGVDPLPSGFAELQPLGGERRLARFAEAEPAPWQTPAAVAKALALASHVRMVLATPAIFGRGWCPGWLDEESLTGSPPDANVRLRLKGACVGHWQPVSGWDMLARQPKRVRRLAPAGSVYFFEVVEGSPESLAQLWLRPVSDERQDQLDGFGLALWGTWSQAPNTTTGEARS
jgi:CRISPR-associated protein Cmr3